MKAIRSLAVFTLICVLTYSYRVYGQLRRDSEGWTTRRVALRELTLDDSQLPGSLTKIQYRQSFGFGHGSSLHYFCDGKLEELTQFAKSQVQQYATELQSVVVIDQEYTSDGESKFHPEWIRPEPNAELFVYRVKEWSPVVIIVDRTNSLLYYFDD
jgi:hypothetical protein